MLKLWGKIIRGHRTVKSVTVEDPHAEWDVLERVKICLDDMIMDLDLPRPIWFEQNEKDIYEFGRTEFHQDHFSEPITFQRLEIEIIEIEED